MFDTNASTAGDAPAQAPSEAAYAPASPGQGPDYTGVVPGQTDYDCKLKYFEAGDASLARFWERLGGHPPSGGLKILDVGCGVGRLAVGFAAAGAAEVVGVDINGDSIAFAREYVDRRHPELVSTLSFRHCEVQQLDERDFDIIVSKDSFEHIMDLETVLNAMAERLKPGGKIYIGFGPLYRGPFGDHGWCGLSLPWAHLVVPERRIICRLNRQPDLFPSWVTAPVESIRDLGLNMRSLATYRRVILDSGLSVVFWKTNAGKHPIVRLSSTIAAVPFLREYFTHNLYCILERPA